MVVLFFKALAHEYRLRSRARQAVLKKCESDACPGPEMSKNTGIFNLSYH